MKRIILALVLIAAVCCPSFGQDASTTVLLHMNGSAANFADSSVSSFVVDAFGNASQIIDPYAALTGSETVCWLDGTGDYIRIATSTTEYSFGTDNFTIDYWIFPQTNFTQWRGHCSVYNTSTRGWMIYTYSTGSVRLSLNSDVTTVLTSGSKALTLNRWNHVALVRKGTGATDMNFYINGVAGDNPVSGNVVLNASQGMVLGRTAVNDNNWYCLGAIDEFRVSKGVARWTTNFTPQRWGYGIQPTNDPIIQTVERGGVVWFGATP